MICKGENYFEFQYTIIPPPFIEGAYLVDYTVEQPNSSPGKVFIFSNIWVWKMFLLPQSNASSYHDSGKKFARMNRVVDE